MRIRRIIIYREFSVRSDQKYLKNRFLKSIYIFLIHFLLNDIILLSIIVNQFKLFSRYFVFFFYFLYRIYLKQQQNCKIDILKKEENIRVSHILKYFIQNYIKFISIKIISIISKLFHY